MNQTTFKPRIASPYRFTPKRKPLDVRDDKHPAREEINKNLGVYKLTATITEDKETLNTFRHINGLTAFLCTITKDDTVIGLGRGMSVLGKNSRFVERAVRFACNASLIDAIVRSTKMLDVLATNDGPDKEVNAILNEAYGEKERVEGMISEKQRGYLVQLIHTKITDPNEQGELSTRLDGMTKLEASQLIAELK